MREFSVVGKIASLFMALGFVAFVAVLWSMFSEVEEFTQDVMRPATNTQHAALNMGYEPPPPKVVVETVAKVERHVARTFSPSISPVVVVLPNALNLRSGPSIHAPKVGQASRGARLEFLRQTSGPWLRVRDEAGEIAGWVYGKYVAGSHTIR
ncbi:MAG: SH3 domain-containing protein [Pseudomonadota bacterium]